MDSQLELMNAKEVAEMLKVSRPTVYALIRNNELPCGYKIGRKRLWAREAITAWIQSNEMKGVAE